MSVIRNAPGLGEQVYQAILDRICDGRLEPGTHLKQEQMAEWLDVSRQPIQQAMARLKADGMVEEVGRRGLRVAAVDLTRMHHHYDIRAVLDGLAARRAAERARDEAGLADEIDRRGRAILADGAAAVAAGATADQIRHDETFHGLLYEKSGNPLLLRTAEPHWRFLRRVMGDVLRHAQTPETIWRQHGEILAAVVAGAPDLAEERAVAHIMDAATMLDRALATTEAGPQEVEG